MKKFFVFVLCASLFCACSPHTQNSNTENVNAEYKIDENIELMLNTTYDAPDISSAQVLEISGDTTVTQGGTYLIKGEKGSVTVNAPKETVTLILDNVSLSCEDGCPLYVYKSEKTFIYLPENTESTLTDGSEYSYTREFYSSADSEPNACIYSKSDVIIYGSGTLNVTGNAKNGITVKDSLAVYGSTLNVNSSNHGITGKESLILSGCTVNTVSVGDGLRSTEDSDTSLGFIACADVNADLTCGEDSVQAETLCYIKSGNVQAVTGNGCTGNIEEDQSAKGIKAGTELIIEDGTFNLNCCDDALHSNGNVSVLGGIFNISTGDDGIHGDENVSVSGGEINIITSYEGIEGKTVSVSGGNIKIKSSDDGINASDGSDGFKVASSCKISISGGKIFIDANGDGIDSNGSIDISGGEIYVEGTLSGGDSALDYDGTAIITGGTVIALGSREMAQNFGNSSTQGSILVSCNSQTDGTVILKNSAGETLLEYSPVKQYSCAVISCPNIKTGENYTVLLGENEFSVTMDSIIYGGTGLGGGFGGGFGGGKGDHSQNGGRFDAPSGDRSDKKDNMPNGNMPEMPDGTPNGDMPEMPDGNIPNGTIPNKPSGDMPLGTPPSGTGFQPNAGQGDGNIPNGQN